MSAPAHPPEITGKQLMAATIEFFDHLASKDRTLQALVTCPGLVPSFLWMKALQSLPEAEKTPWIKWELIRATQDRLDNHCSRQDAIVSIAVLGTSRKEQQEAMIESFSHDIISEGDRKAGQYSGLYHSRDLDGTARAPIRFEIEFRQARTVEHPVTQLRIPRQTNGEDIRILTVDPPRIVLKALRAIDLEHGDASRDSSRSPSTAWTSLLMFARAINAWNSDLVTLPLPPPLSVAKAQQDLSSLYQGNESLEIKRWLKVFQERDSGISNEERQACTTFLPYFSATTLTPLYSSPKNIAPPFPEFPTNPHHVHQRRDIESLENEPTHRTFAFLPW